MNPSSSLERHGCIPGTGAALFSESLLANRIEGKSLSAACISAARTSRPPRVSGRVSTWIGNGSVNAAGGEHTDQRCAHARSVKVLCVVTFGASRASGVPMVATGRAPLSTRVARLPVGKIDRRDESKPSRRVPPRRRAYRRNRPLSEF